MWVMQSEITYFPSPRAKAVCCSRRRRELRFVPGIYAVVGWISGSMITAFTASADSVSRIWKRCERTDIWPKYGQDILLGTTLRRNMQSRSKRICPCGSKKRRRLALDFLYLLQVAPRFPGLELVCDHPSIHRDRGASHVRRIIQTLQRSNAGSTEFLHHFRPIASGSRAMRKLCQ